MCWNIYTIKITLNSTPTDIPTFKAIKTLILVKSCFNTY